MGPFSTLILFVFVTHPQEWEDFMRAQLDNDPLSATHQTIEHDYQFRQVSNDGVNNFQRIALEGCRTDWHGGALDW